jgi:hypothetical protein
LRGAAYDYGTEGFVASPVRSERHVRELRWDRGLIFGLIRLRSPTFIGVRINAAMQVADVNGIQRTIIQTPENRKVGGSTPPLATELLVERMQQRSWQDQPPQYPHFSRDSLTVH